MIELLAQRYPERDLRTNVEFYAGVVMESCGLPASLFTAAFATSRIVGWGAHVLEQADDHPHPAPERPLHRSRGTRAPAHQLSGTNRGVHTSLGVWTMVNTGGGDDGPHG